MQQYGQNKRQYKKARRKGTLLISAKKSISGKYIPGMLF